MNNDNYRNTGIYFTNMDAIKSMIDYALVVNLAEIFVHHVEEKNIMINQHYIIKIPEFYITFGGKAFDTYDEAIKYMVKWLNQKNIFKDIEKRIHKDKVKEFYDDCMDYILKYRKPNGSLIEKSFKALDDKAAALEAIFVETKSQASNEEDIEFWDRYYNETQAKDIMKDNENDFKATEYDRILSLKNKSKDYIIWLIDDKR